MIGIFSDEFSSFGKMQKPIGMREVIRKVVDMANYGNEATKLANDAGLNVQMVSWEDCARDKGSSWGPCISDMTLRVNGSCMPVIRRPNFSDVTWDVKMKDIPIVVGNHISGAKGVPLQTISLKDYLENFSDFMTNDHYRKKQSSFDIFKSNKINLLASKGFTKTGKRCGSKEGKNSHVVMSSQCCFLPIVKKEETKFNVALYNYQSHSRNPAVLVIVSTSKGSSAQIIEGREQYLLFNNFGKKADFVGERVSDVRRKKGQKNIHDKVLSKQEKQDNVIVIVQVPLKQKVMKRPLFAANSLNNLFGGFGGGAPVSKGAMAMPQGPSQNSFDMMDMEMEDDDDVEEEALVMRSMQAAKPKANVEAAMVSVAERTKPVCVCGAELQKFQVRFAYDGDVKISCDKCGKLVEGKEEMVYHCPKAKVYPHPNGYDLCLGCGDKQLQFDELRGLLETDKDYKLERNEEYPVRVTLQYYKATNNGVINKEIMDDIVKQLEQSQKQADFMGSLVTEYDPKRPTEFVEKKQDIPKQEDPPKVVDDAKIEPKPDDTDIPTGDDGYAKIRAMLKKHCGKDWETFMKNFESEEVTDGDLASITADDLKELIPKMGPRNRFKKWMDQQLAQ